MKVKELTQAWVKQEKARVVRTREIAKMLEAEIGDQEISLDWLVAKFMQRYGEEPIREVANRLATRETMAIYELMRDL